MSEMRKKAEELLLAWEDGEHPEASEIAGLAEVIRSDDELRERYDNLVEFERSLNLDASFAAQAERIAVAVSGASEAAPPEVTAKKDRTFEWMALAAIVAVALLIWLIPSQGASGPPVMQLEVSGGEKEMLGPEDPKPEIKFSAATGMQLVLRPEQETKLVPEVSALVVWADQQHEMKLNWEHAPSGSMRFKGKLPAPTIDAPADTVLKVSLDYGCAEATCKQVLERKVTLLPKP